MSLLLSYTPALFISCSGNVNDLFGEDRKRFRNIKRSFRKLFLNSEVVSNTTKDIKGRAGSGNPLDIELDQGTNVVAICVEKFGKLQRGSKCTGV